ncbi:MAG: MOSC domain-containing protein [Anaerolineales bacterium]
MNISEGGVPKYPIQTAIITPLGIQGDYHQDLAHHGGFERALCIYSLEKIQALQKEGHPIFPGSVGENLTLSGIDWEQLETGTLFRFPSGVELELTRPTTPCKTILDSFLEGNIQRISHKHYPGWSRWYARVNRVGVIHSGDTVEVIIQN